MPQKHLVGHPWKEGDRFGGSGLGYSDQRSCQQGSGEQDLQHLNRDAVLNQRRVEVVVWKRQRLVPLADFARNLSQAIPKGCDQTLWLFLGKMFIGVIPQSSL